MAVNGQDEFAGESVCREPFVLPAQFHGVEDTPNIVPGECTDQPLVAIAQFLAAHLERHGKFLVIAEREVSLVQIHAVLLWTSKLPVIAGSGHRSRASPAPAVTVS